MRRQRLAIFENVLICFDEDGIDSIEIYVETLISHWERL